MVQLTLPPISGEKEERGLAFNSSGLGNVTLLVLEQPCEEGMVIPSSQEGKPRLREDHVLFQAMLQGRDYCGF